MLTGQGEKGRRDHEVTAEIDTRAKDLLASNTDSEETVQMQQAAASRMSLVAATPAGVGHFRLGNVEWAISLPKTPLQVTLEKTSIPS